MCLRSCFRSIHDVATISTAIHRVHLTHTIPAAAKRRFCSALIHSIATIYAYSTPQLLNNSTMGLNSEFPWQFRLVSWVCVGRVWAVRLRAQRVRARCAVLWLFCACVDVSARIRTPAR